MNSLKETMIRTIRYGAGSLYHPESGMLVITDLVDGSERENEKHGIRAGNGDWIFGIMTYMIPSGEAEAIIAQYGSLTEYALECIPAPGTFSSRKMGFEPIDKVEDLEGVVNALLFEHSEGWVIGS